MKRILSLALATLVVTTGASVFTGCGGGGDGEANITVAKVTDPSTDLALVVGTPNEFFTVFGVKNSDGYLAGKASGAVYVNPDGSWIQVTLGGDGNPESLTLSDGSSVRFGSYSGSSATATFYDASGHALGTESVDTSELLAGKAQLSKLTVNGVEYRWAGLAFKWAVAVTATTVGVATGNPVLTVWGAGQIAGAVMSTVLYLTPDDIRQAGSLALVSGTIASGNYAGVAVSLTGIWIDNLAIGGSGGSTDDNTSSGGPTYTTISGTWRVQQSPNPSWPPEGQFSRSGTVNITQSGSSFVAVWTSVDGDTPPAEPSTGTISGQVVHIVGGGENPQVWDGTVNDEFTAMSGTWGIPAYSASGGTWSASRQ